MKFNVGDRVHSIRRPGFYGTVTKTDLHQYVNPEHNRIQVKWDKLTKDSRGRWKSGTLDELPIDLHSSRSPIYLPAREKKMSVSEYARTLGNKRLIER